MSFYYEQSERTERTRYNNTHVFYEDGTTEEYKYDEYQNKIYEKVDSIGEFTSKM